MSYKQNIVGVTFTNEERARLDELAKLQGTKTSTLAKRYVEKGIREDFSKFHEALRADGFDIPEEKRELLNRLIGANLHLLVQ